MIGHSDQGVVTSSITSGRYERLTSFAVAGGCPTAATLSSFGRGSGSPRGWTVTWEVREVFTVKRDVLGRYGSLATAARSSTRVAPRKPTSGFSPSKMSSEVFRFQPSIQRLPPRALYKVVALLTRLERGVSADPAGGRSNLQFERGQSLNMGRAAAAARVQPGASNRPT